jgi:flagellar hook-basal body complex protein FliE
MAIEGIGAVSGVTPTGYLQRTNTANSAEGVGGVAFGEAITSAVDNAQSLSATSKTMAVQAITGDLNDIHNATIASTRAQVTLELVTAMRNKGVDAFNEIMKMQG